MTKLEMLGAVDELIERWTAAREILASLRTALERDPVAEAKVQLSAGADEEGKEPPKRRRGRPPGSGRRARPEEPSALGGKVPEGPVVVSAAMVAQRRRPAETSVETGSVAPDSEAGAYSLESLVRELSRQQGGAA